MTSFARRAAGWVTILEALWLLYAYFDAVPPVGAHIGPVPFIPTYSVAALVLAIITLADGALGVWGASFAHMAGAVLSGAVLLVTGATVVIASGDAYPSAGSDALVGVAFALVALVFNLQAMRSKGGISEQANPMNLPVFG
ncbi:MAG: hypothetical protein JRM80_02410 [Nitrososphaerota archaeon]|nr:hypothetical protein [Nitrososphaerota archaeon]